MDRREALKKMAIGGATIAGATAVLSSPAFAYGEPTNTSIDVAVQYPYTHIAKVRFTITPTFTCPGSSTKQNGFKTLSTTISVVTMNPNPADPNPRPPDNGPNAGVSISFRPFPNPNLSNNQTSARFWYSDSQTGTKITGVNDFVLIHNVLDGSRHPISYQEDDKFRLDITGTVACKAGNRPEKTAPVTLTKFFRLTGGGTWNPQDS